MNKLRTHGSRLVGLAFFGFLLWVAPAAQAATFIVTNTNDSGAGSLRQAIINSNNSVGFFDAIHFNIPGGGVKTINLLSALPPITDPLQIDGNSQPGFSGTPIIELNGSSAGNSADGLAIVAGASDIRGLVINRFKQSGIDIQTKGGNTIIGCYIGTSASGTLDLGNAFGVYISSPNNTIGGTSAASRNVISGNGGHGIGIVQNNASGNVIRGNHIGTNAAGTAALPNGFGMYIAAPGNIIGGTAAGARNIISGNDTQGILLNGAAANGNILQGNYIGTNINGNVALGNASVALNIDGAPNNIIGGAAAGAGNVISGTVSGNGILLYNAGATGNQIKGNFIGSDKTGFNPLPNSTGIYISQSAAGNHIGGVLSGEGNLIAFNVQSGIRQNSVGVGNDMLRNRIFGNGSLGIDLGAVFGVTPNDAGDADIGANNLQNFPLLTYVARDISSTNFVGSLNSKPNTEYRVEFFHNPTCDPSGHGQGQNYLGAIPSLITNGSGNANFNVVLALVQPTIGQFVSSIATDSSGNTSEFSPCQVINSAGAGYFAFTDANFEVSEGAGTGTFTVARGGGSSVAASVNYAVTNGTATAPADFVLASGTLNFAVGETSKTVPFSVINDSLDETDETANLAITNPTNGSTLSSPNTAIMTIKDDDVAPSKTVQFSAANYNTQESNHTVIITVTRTGDASQSATVDYATSDLDASERADYTTALGTLRFGPGESSKSFEVLLTDDAFVEAPEVVQLTLSNPSGDLSLVSQSVATLTITSDDPAPTFVNPIDEAQLFVRQHYHDFLNREPDAAGLNFWTSQLTSCGADAECLEVKRQNVSAAFFLSIEFQETGFLVARLNQASYQTIPGYRAFLRDTQEIGRGVVVGQGTWQTQLEQNKVALIESWVQRGEFVSAFGSLPDAQYVDALFANTGAMPDQGTRDALVIGLQNQSETRATVLRKVAENAAVTQRLTNPSFVLMEYIGYLRRSPNDAPDTNLDGYNFWLNKLNQAGGDYQKSEMVKSFLVSSEYRSHFGQP